MNKITNTRTSWYLKKHILIVLITNLNMFLMLICSKCSKELSILHSEFHVYSDTFLLVILISRLLAPILRPNSIWSQEKTAEDQEEGLSPVVSIKMVMLLIL